MVGKKKVFSKKFRKRINILGKKLDTLFILVLIIFILAILIGIDKKKKSNIDSFIIINSPLNQTYQEKNIILNVSCNGLCEWIKSKIDDGDLSRVNCGNGEPCIVTPDDELFVNECTFCYGFVKYNLEFLEGTHKITFKFKYNGSEYIKEIWFNVNLSQ